ncbi:cytochrome c oxidase assembly protein [Arthrobacter sp. 260]|uniref:cytochrome c oxidase assembly protein n=1 Tax=Arthrobacter sp. 260 TaxID=2735314 RepID=UPI001E521B30|nr:cytochrome c oxidase assembly protein [Arthrobacter sp. 260]
MTGITHSGPTAPQGEPVSSGPDTDPAHESGTDRSPETGIPERSIVRVVLGIALPVSLAVAILAMYFSEALTTYRTTMADPGDFVVHARPAARVVQDLSAALTIGFLVLCAGLLPASGRDKSIIGFAQWKALRWAGWSAGVWFVSSVASLALIAADTAGQSMLSPGFFSIFLFFATELELGQILLVALMAVLILVVMLPMVRSTTGAGIALGIAMLGILPLALAGHAAGSDDHGNAVNSLALHLIGVCVWVGGLAAVLLLGSQLGKDTGRVLRRYSALAVWAFGAVAFSGIINASLRLGSFADLATPYGILVLVKVSSLTALGLAGWYQRRRILPRLDRNPEDRRAFTIFGVSEAALMIVTIGVSAGLAASPPPVPQGSIADVDLRRSLLGYPFPEPLTVSSFMTSWHPDWTIGLLILVAGGAYLAAVVKIRRRGDAWSIPRTLAFLAGCALLIWLTSGGPAVYGRTSFSGHMIQHMGLMMYAPVLFVLGAPILLLLKATRPRTDGSRGLREWVLWLFRSRFSRFLTRPPVAGLIFVGSMVGFYYSPIFDLALSTHVGHVFMIVHFLITGYLFAWVLIGIDPGPARSPYPFRLIILLATMAFHAFFGLSLLGGTEILAPSWWASLQLTDSAALLADQQRGGAIAWGIGEIPTVLLALGVAMAWRKDDERTAVREDRAADRDDDAKLTAYNQHLESLQRRSSGR